MRSICLLPAMLLATSCAMGGTVLDRVEVRAAQPPELASSESAYAVAKRQLALGNVGLAIDSFRKAIRQDPGSADALNGLAVAYDRAGRFDLSRQTYEEALALAPSDRAILHNLKRSLTAQGLHREAARIATELGEMEVAAIEPRPKPAPAPRPEKSLRIERISGQEVALVTTGRRNGWEAVTNRPAITAIRQPRPYAVSKGGALELALPSPAAGPEPLVTVLNGVGSRGLARRMSGFLRQQGWSRTAIGDSRARPAGSLLVHAPKDHLNALLLAKTLPFQPRLVVSGKARSVILLLGRNAAGFNAAAS